MKTEAELQKEYSITWRKENPTYKNEWAIKNPEKRYAHGVAQRKSIKKERCEHCNSKEDLQGHHPDYSKPLYIITLCRSCHRRLHAEVKLIQ